MNLIDCMYNESYIGQVSTDETPEIGLIVEIEDEGRFEITAFNQSSTDQFDADVEPIDD